MCDGQGGAVHRANTGPDGTSETVEKIGSDANDFSKPQKGNRKSPAASQCCKGLSRGYGAP